MKIHVTRISEQRQNRAEEAFKDIKASYFPKIYKDITPQIQEVLRIPRSMNNNDSKGVITENQNLEGNQR